ncbi:cell division protein FtsQ/DivIB [Alteraurantiacibacter aquimixticola]|uniref:Cell division protein FtsQ n=1 Tax=Alteraurantiacibacter aquimixticola TaxID=2489173 RepID=A0A4T3F2M3_9SPHN|nr:FtsQ-type POTRA domain-containing protein [Alteraurantiacibacter aquimixticola]TIX51378.1 FtsQ-type POTRA domain-containing protein [Alteraurantiacibacter aquimixticola]
MAQTIRRKATGVRRQAKSQGRAGQVRKARAKTNSLFDRMMDALPFTEDQWHAFFTVLILAVLLAIAIVVARVSGLTTVAETEFAKAAANAGYKVGNVQVRGTDRLNEARVYERALGREDLSMPLVDLEELRTELLALNWVADARVSRLLPDTLVIDIVEREPHAVLRRGERLLLIDPTGAELEPISRSAASEYLVISGEGAQSQVEALTDLLDAAPALQPQVKAAEWIGNRRWDLTFATDQSLSLPEGAERAAAALISFARADGVHRLIGGEVVRFDMRNPPRMYMQVPGRADRELAMEQAAEQAAAQEEEDN